MTTSTKIPPAPTWDLESVIPGGPKSPEFAKHRDKVVAGLEKARAMTDALPKTLSVDSQNDWAKLIMFLQDLAEEIDLEVNFCHCHASADVSNNDAHAGEAKGLQHWSEWEKLKGEFDALALKQSDEAWTDLLAQANMQEIAFALNWDREWAKKKLGVELESLILELSVDGYHGWNLIYDRMAGNLRAEFEEDGEMKEVSMGQLATKMSHKNRDIRKQAFEKLTEAWDSAADLAAMALNSQAGFRLAMYKRRGWDSIQMEPLHMARMNQGSLDAMWSAISKGVPNLRGYIDAKKKLLGIDNWAWYDQFSPCGQVDRMYPYDEAADFVVKHVGGFSSDMAEFYRKAIDKRWIEAEDRSGKAGGGYCTGTGPLRQSRIFMTYAGSYENLLTLAHELGHAYHSFVLKDRPAFATSYPMTLAETASIFSELLVTDAALDSCDDPQEKLMLLDQKLQQPYTFFTDLHCRYLFDVAFYDERAKGVVSKDRLCELMVEAQKEAFGDLLDEGGHHPLFWASKLHFFLTDVPFYNYPYTVGYLFAGGVYDQAKKEGSSFAEKYRALLADTGSMTTEQVALKHMGVDLSGEEFWRNAVARSLADVDTFAKLAQELA